MILAIDIGNTTARRCRALLIACLLSVHMPPPAQAQPEAPGTPGWWDEIYMELPRKADVIEQYFYVTETLLQPAYRASGTERDNLLKRSIKAYTLLIDWFTATTDMPTVSLAQYQIAEAYRRLGDVPRARHSYQQCLTYRTYAHDPPRDRADGTILAVIARAQQKLKEL